MQRRPDLARRTFECAALTLLYFLLARGWQLLPVSEGGMNLKTTDINRLIETLGVQSLSGGK